MITSDAYSIQQIPNENKIVITLPPSTSTIKLFKDSELCALLNLAKILNEGNIEVTE